MVNFTSRQKVLFIFATILSTLLFLIGKERLTDIIIGTNKQKIYMPTLSKNFAELPIHKGDERMANMESFDKGAIKGVTAKFISSEPPEKILSYYSHILPPLGWRLSNDHVMANGKIKFCKSGISLIVDTSATETGTKYYLGLVWTTFRHISSYCAK